MPVNATVPTDRNINVRQSSHPQSILAAHFRYKERHARDFGCHDRHSGGEVLVRTNVRHGPTSTRTGGDPMRKLPHRWCVRGEGVTTSTSQSALSGLLANYLGIIHTDRMLAGVHTGPCVSEPAVTHAYQRNLATSKVISGWALTCDSAHSWRLYSTDPLGD